MKHKTIKTCLFLGTLLTLSVSMDMIYGVKNSSKDTAAPQGDGLENLSLEKNIQLLLPLMESHSVEKLVDKLRKTSPDRVYAILKKLWPFGLLTRDELVQTIFGTALFYPDNKEQQFKILDLILENQELHTGNPLLYVAAYSSYPEIISQLLLWAKERLQMEHQVLFTDMLRKSLSIAVTNNDLDSLQTLHKNGAYIFPELATELLWVAVESNSSPETVKFIIEQGAQLNNVRSGYTPLIKAVRLNNFPLVKTLTEAGSDLSFIAHDEVGSALQQAVTSGATQIELYLRENGAKE